MAKTNITASTAHTRRDVLKKAGIASVFIIPTITSFKINELAQAASYCPPHNPNRRRRRHR